MVKKVRQRYFVCRELRFSVAIIILWALLVTTLFSYFAGRLGDKLGHGVLFFSIIAAGYIIIIIVLTMLFSHRLIGPFQRLKTEIKLIRAGEYNKRLAIRNNDDLYLRSFIDEVNKILQELESVQKCRDDLVRDIDSWIPELLSVIEGGNASTEELREEVVSVRNRVQKILEENLD